MIRRTSLFLFALAGLVSCGIAGAMLMKPVDVTEMTVDGTDLHVSGVLNSETHGEFIMVFANYPQINRLILGKIEGSVDDEANFPFYREVRERGLGTYLKADSEVYSGGADLFIAGATREMEAGAIIGVHSWSDGEKDASDYPRDNPVHEVNRAYTEDMLGDDAWYWFTIHSAPAEGMHVMTAEQIQQYGLLTGPVIQ